MINKGEKFEHVFEVTKMLSGGFIELFNDRNPLHVDRKFAIEKGFKEEVVHGNILGGFLSFFIGECLPLKNVIIQSQEIKYKKPIYNQSKLLFKAEVVNYFASVSVIEIIYVFELFHTNEVVAKGKIQIGII